MNLLNSGNVGIGTATPGSKLEVNGCAQVLHQAGNNYGLRVAAASASPGPVIGSIQFTNNAGNVDWSYLTANSQSKSVWRTWNGSTANSSNSAFDINGGTVVIQCYLGAAPYDKGDWPQPALGLKNYDINFNGLTMLTFGYLNDEVSYDTDSKVWNFRFWGANGATTSSAATELWLSGPGPLCMVAGGTNGSGYGVRLNIGATSWVAISDENLKEDLVSIESATDKIMTLRTVMGKYKADKTGTRRPFLLAQEVQKVLPEAVSTGMVREAVDPDNPSKVLSESECLFLSYTDMIPLVIASIKEQQALITSQQKSITDLTALITTQKTRIDTQQTSITDLTALVTTQQTSITDLTALVTSQQTLITSQQDSIVALTDRIAALENPVQ
ncbi:MAG: hypothetical protein EBY20_04250 [Alphaproteobacteria bacterium]|nr:hypothetical protein [Alphaproteobacteria bacterium]